MPPLFGRHLPLALMGVVSVVLAGCAAEPLAQLAASRTEPAAAGRMLSDVAGQARSRPAGRVIPAVNPAPTGAAANSAPAGGMAIGRASVGGPQVMPAAAGCAAPDGNPGSSGCDVNPLAALLRWTGQSVSGFGMTQPSR
jgi:hypothetical protein